MKILFVVVGICFTLLSTTASVYACDCDTSQNLTAHPQMTFDKLSYSDIAALQQQGEKEGWTFTVSKNPATNYSSNELCGLVAPENWWVDKPFDPCEPTGDLPARFDWRELGGCTPIKNQASCGSCWAFGTVGPLECNIKIKDQQTVDLSEQWLVSCNRDGWGCNGGWWAHDYHKSKTDSCGGTGAVLESDFPYVAQDVPCNCPYPHAYLIDRWAYIGSAYGVPSVSAMKQAIIKYGPISAGVYVSSAFGAYSEGVFNECSSGQINHAVTIVGWDDNQGAHGVWFLRNSWSPGWGEDGYMRIQYNCNSIGYGACYVVYKGGIPTTTFNVSIQGGRGITVGVKNTGTENGLYASWNISVTGGLLGLINIQQQGSLPVFTAGKTIEENIRPFGFGPITITVVANAPNAEKITKTVDAFTLLGLCLLWPNS